MAALATLTRRGGALCASAASSTPSGLFYQASRSLFVKAPGNPTQARARALFLAVCRRGSRFLPVAVCLRRPDRGGRHGAPHAHAACMRHHIVLIVSPPFAGAGKVAGENVARRRGEAAAGAPREFFFAPLAQKQQRERQRAPVLPFSIKRAVAPRRAALSQAQVRAAKEQEGGRVQRRKAHARGAGGEALARPANTALLTRWCGPAAAGGAACGCRRHPVATHSSYALLCTIA